MLLWNWHPWQNTYCIWSIHATAFEFIRRCTNSIVVNWVTALSRCFLGLLDCYVRLFAVNRTPFSIMHKVLLYNSHVTEFPFVDDESILCCVCIDKRPIDRPAKINPSQYNNDTMCICTYILHCLHSTCIYDFIAIYFPPQLQNRTTEIRRRQ